jgi:alpha-L-rhamnosidase
MFDKRRSREMNNIEALTCWEQLPVNMRPQIRYWLPAGLVDEADIKEEIHALYERGFGGVEIVSFIASSAVVIAQAINDENRWGSKYWNEMMRCISEETKKLGMSMDITNGPGWPISSPKITSVFDEAILCELTFGETVVSSGYHYNDELPKRRKVHKKGNPRLINVFAYEEASEGILLVDSYIDLMPFVKEESNRLYYEFPKTKGNHWKLFAFYEQPAIHMANGGNCYVIDHLSEKGAKSCENYWDEVFSQYDYEAMESFFCDSLEYNVALDWTPEFLEEFECRRGYSLLPYLPFIGLDNLFPACDIPGYQLENNLISEMVNQDYLETVTQLYCEKHLSVLEKMASKYGKKLRYQTAYNKPIEVERSALYLSIPENEALGRVAIDFQKNMAAAVHLGRKEKYSFECAAEFGNNYGQDYEDLFWWVKRSFMAGINAQVIHGASYSGSYQGINSVDGNIPGVKWPGYEAFMKTVSNDWNRTLSVEDAKECTDTITRLNIIFRKQAKVDCAIYRASYSNDGAGNEFCLYPDGGILSNQGYSYEFISEFLLNMDVCTVQDRILDKEGVGYKCLIIPETKNVSVDFLNQVKKLSLSGFPIVWVGEKPIGSRYYGEWNTIEKQEIWQKLMTLVWKMSEITHVERMEMVPDKLEELKIRPEIWLEGKMDIMTATRVDLKEKCQYFALYGYNRIECKPEEPNLDELSCSAIFKKGTVKGSYDRPGKVSQRRIQVKLKGKGDIYRCNPWSGRIERQLFVYDENIDYMTGELEIQEDELIILTKMPAQTSKVIVKEQLISNTPIRFTTLELESFEPDTVQETSFLRSHFITTKTVFNLDELLPWSELNGGLENFSGRGTYNGFIELDDSNNNLSEVTRKYILSLGNVSDTFRVWVNDNPAVFPEQDMKRVDITNLLHNGKNLIKIVVTSNLYNRLFSAKIKEENPKLSYLPRNYGIWESEGKKTELLIYETQRSKN